MYKMYTIFFLGEVVVLDIEIDYEIGQQVYYIKDTFTDLSGQNKHPAVFVGDIQAIVVKQDDDLTIPVIVVDNISIPFDNVLETLDAALVRYAVILTELYELSTIE